MRAYGAAVDHASPRKWPGGELPEDEVLGNGHRQHRSGVLAVLGDDRPRCIPEELWSQPLEGGASDRDLPRGWLPHPGEQLDQLALPIPVDAGDAEDLVLTNLEL